jgi:hypothetical protein
MSHELRFHPLAEEEVLTAAAWYAERSRQTADLFVSLLRRLIGRLPAR